MTSDEIEKLSRRILGRPEHDDLEDELLAEFQKACKAYEATIAAQDKTIVLLRETIALLKGRD